MKFDLVLCGVGGQGILSIAFVVDNAAHAGGLTFKQSEVHGMAQRGGAVSSHVRVSDAPIFSDIVALGRADMLLAVEPMEALRHRRFLSATGVVVANTGPVKNVPGYPEKDRLLAELLRLNRVVLVNADKVAREAGSPRSKNMAVLGAASPHLPLDLDTMERFIETLFARKGEKAVAANHAAFRNGRAAGEFYGRCVSDGTEPRSVLNLMDHLDSTALVPGAAHAWSAFLQSPGAQSLFDFLRGNGTHVLNPDPRTAKRLMNEGPGFLADV